MSEEDVYDAEMSNWPFTDRDAERILTGGNPEDAALARLAAVLTALHRHDVGALSDEQIARFAEQAAMVTAQTRPETVPARSTRSGRLMPALRHKLAVISAAILVLSGMMGVAVASDEAVPGHPLYGLDLALENLGIGAGGAIERISEAQALANSGQVSEAIDHVAGAIAGSSADAQSDDFSPEAANAASALRDAAAAVEADHDNQESQQVRGAVAAMLDEMAGMVADPEFDGESFGRRISEMARQIAGPDADGPGLDGASGEPDTDGDNGPPSGVPEGPPEGTPTGPPGGANRP